MFRIIPVTEEEALEVIERNDDLITIPMDIYMKLRDNQKTPRKKREPKTPDTSGIYPANTGEDMRNG